MKKKIVMAGFVASLLFLSGCDQQKTQVYISKDGNYTFQYPGSWKRVDDERQLSILRRDINGLLPEAIQMTSNPDVVLTGPSGTFGSVIQLPVPDNFRDRPDALHELVSSNNDQTGFEDRYYHASSGGNEFRVRTAPTGDGGETFVARTIHGSTCYQIQFACTSGGSLKRMSEFDAIIESFRFDRNAVLTAAAEMKKRQEGFFTGLWHGALWLPRWVLSLFMTIDVYADNNTGGGYLAGFILGILMVLRGGGSSRR